ncbi:MAG: D-2-hydroxyacid dehydrogenase [Rhodospirillaceae bacterium]|jgi:phosphoglycerate dehydrogenase-like enzyme|nr:D-2-hydroxyacid dehydrogenase [Rhodospirillaceae bacterium]MBT3490836.1 D-2-hydroxyacid dehydrogenase [Rhodospirillaceae bacterium]MBT3781088.1 D-2-hydroxyacid dehydrogenase [Rhodospirillaceae bacterium]MBT3977456.1 D-2-hydroxyacid dehydrogenase [Rhodospirillaceae bacterium]MBT4170353.1 D-2-hydroxyacid dehydrogenase [Rhodospirillaceae bacterium]
MNLKDITIHFAHPAYQLSTLFDLRQTGIKHFQTWTHDDLRARIGEGDVLVISGYWKNELLPDADKLRFAQVCGAGYDMFDLDAVRAKGVRLAHASGINVNGVSDHAMALLLALTRQIHTGRDNQRKGIWRGMISDLAKREDELPGKTMVIYGMGKIGSRLARLAKAFDMTVLGLKRDVSTQIEHVDELHPSEALVDLLPRADVTVLTCPLTEETRNVIDGPALAAMKPSSYLINVARGGCVDEAALVEALRGGAIAGAGIDVTVPEPLAPASDLWGLENVILTPHTGGETTKYEDNVIDILLENLGRLSRGEASLHNQVI